MVLTMIYGPTVYASLDELQLPSTRQVQTDQIHSNPPPIPNRILANRDRRNPPNTKVLLSMCKHDPYCRALETLLNQTPRYYCRCANEALGCTRSTCLHSERMNSESSISANGFVGGNVRGWVELGLSRGWGRLNPLSCRQQYYLGSLWSCRPFAKGGGKIRDYKSKSTDDRSSKQQQSLCWPIITNPCLAQRSRGCIRRNWSCIRSLLITFFFTTRGHECQI